MKIDWSKECEEATIEMMRSFGLIDENEEKLED